MTTAAGDPVAVTADEFTARGPLHLADGVAERRDRVCFSAWTIWAVVPSGLDGFGYVEAATLQEAADRLVARVRA